MVGTYNNNIAWLENLTYFIIIIIIIMTLCSLSADCKALPSPSNGAVQLVFSSSNQLMAVFSCDPGYAAIGQTVVSCSNGKWSQIPPLCTCEHSQSLYQLYTH